MSMIDANTCALLGPFFVGASLAYESLFVGVSLASVDIGLPWLLLFVVFSLFFFVTGSGNYMHLGTVGVLRGRPWRVSRPATW